MRLRSVLRYTSTAGGPLSYRSKIMLIAVLPFLPFFIFDLEPRSSAIAEGYFWLSTIWFLVIAAVGVKQLLSAIWVKPR